MNKPCKRRYEKAQKNSALEKLAWVVYIRYSFKSLFVLQQIFMLSYYLFHGNPLYLCQLQQETESITI